MVRTTVWSVIVAIVLWLAALQPVRAESSPLYQPRIDSPFVPTQPEQIAKLEIARIRSGVLPGVVVGGHYEGMLKILQQRYIATGELDERLEDSARHLLEDELNQAGYSVMRAHQNSIFAEELVDESEPGRFLIGGTITRAKLKSYSSLLGDLTQDERTIRWEVFDRNSNKVVYQQETMGRAEAEGIDNPAATYEAIRASFKTFLTEPTLITLLNQPAIDHWVSPHSYQIAAVPSSSQPLTIEQIVGRSIPSIVQIGTPQGRGSGFLIDSSGLIVTNQHVVGSAFSVKVSLYDGITRIGRVLRRDAVSDAALVKLENDVLGIHGLPICHTNLIRIGQSVVAIGNPLSLSNTVTQGIVSGFRRGASRSLIQTDTAVNPGNSGGPLLNRQGAVIGIVTEKIASGGIEGLGFALPISEVLQRLKVEVNAPSDSRLDACGNPTVDYRPGVSVADSL